MPLAGIFIIWLILEIITTIFVAKLIGWRLVLGLFVLGIIAAVALMKWQKKTFEARLAKDPQNAMKDQIANAFIPIAFAVPGFLSDIFGLLMLNPNIRRQLSAKFFGTISADSIIEQAMAMSGQPNNSTVIDVEAKNTTSATSTTSTANPVIQNIPASDAENKPAGKKSRIAGAIDAAVNTDKK
ncbi:MAG: FxsA family protein [Cardiobacteriaceae bacterium]|nr:FxsA family protein [Cardiobacteriaceae bacterium]